MRFPASEIPRVREELQALLHPGVRALVCSAACGADLLALEAAGAAGIERHVVLPFSVETFRETSVTDRPGDWGPLYDRVIAEVRRSGSVDEHAGDPEDPGVYLAANEWIVERALALAEEGGTQRSCVAVVVWDGAPRGDDDATEDFRRRADEAGFTPWRVSTTDLESLVAALLRAVDELDREAVAKYCDTLCARAYRLHDPIPLSPALKVIRALQRKRWFDLEEQVCETLLQTGERALEVRRRLVQALIDQGKLASAQLHLERLIPDSIDEVDEHAEARGLLGRALKQRYVNANAPGVRRNRWALQRAIATYAAAYQETASDPLWHGINLVACLARARRDGVSVPPGMPDDRELAATLRARAEEAFRADPTNIWAAATALEACVALNDREAALSWAEAYVEPDYADAFELGSTLRQLVEVWQLEATPREIGGAVLPALRSAILGKENGGVELQSAEVRETPTLQKVFGLDSFVTFPWYACGLERARLVARIADRFGRPEGTGFLVRGRDVAPRFAGEPWLLLTNDHVVNDRGRKGLQPVEAWASFEAITAGSRYAVDEVLWCSPPTECDVSVLRLKGLPPGLDAIEPYPVGSIPATGLARAGQHGQTPPPRVYVIGYPLGGGLSFSIHDNKLLGCRLPLLHYRTPTQGGSSGSPVFNDRWELIGIHHAGDERVRRLDGGPGRYAANEGIAMISIRQAIDATPQP